MNSNQLNYLFHKALHMSDLHIELPCFDSSSYDVGVRTLARLIAHSLDLLLPELPCLLSTETVDK